MNISQYWVGQIPAEPMAIDVRNSMGEPLNLLGYTAFQVKVLDPDNDEVDLTDSTLSTAQIASGRFVFRWPVGRSVFDEPGDYLLQLELDGDGVKDFTTVHHIKVRRLGGTN